MLIRSVYIFSLILLLCSCSFISTGSVKMPPSWPLKEIAPLPGSKQVNVSDSEKYIDNEIRDIKVDGFDVGYRNWEVAYTNNQAWEMNRDAIESIVKEQNYLIYNDLDGYGIKQVSYYSSDYKTYVCLTFDSSKSKYELSIHLRNFPLPKISQLGRPIP